MVAVLNMVTFAEEIFNGKRRFCAVFINRVLMNLDNLGFKKAIF